MGKLIYSFPIMIFDWAFLPYVFIVFWVLNILLDYYVKTQFSHFSTGEVFFNITQLFGKPALISYDSTISKDPSSLSGFLNDITHRPSLYISEIVKKKVRNSRDSSTKQITIHKRSVDISRFFKLDREITSDELTSFCRSKNPLKVAHFHKEINNGNDILSRLSSDIEQNFLRYHIPNGDSYSVKIHFRQPCVTIFHPSLLRSMLNCNFTKFFLTVFTFGIYYCFQRHLLKKTGHVLNYSLKPEFTFEKLKEQLEPRFRRAPAYRQFESETLPEDTNFDNFLYLVDSRTQTNPNLASPLFPSPKIDRLWNFLSFDLEAFDDDLPCPPHSINNLKTFINQLNTSIHSKSFCFKTRPFLYIFKWASSTLLLITITLLFTIFYASIDLFPMFAISVMIYLTLVTYVDDFFQKRNSFMTFFIQDQLYYAIDSDPNLQIFDMSFFKNRIGIAVLPASPPSYGSTRSQSPPPPFKPFPVIRGPTAPDTSFP